MDTYSIIGAVITLIPLVLIVSIAIKRGRHLLDQ